MFSDMNKVTQKIPTARDPKTQQTDTREEIRRHDPEHERKKGEHKGFAEEQGIFGDDQTEVSVQSLDTFLPMLLKNYGGKDSSQDRVQASEKIDHTNPSAKAAGAYAKMAKYAPVKSNVPVEEDLKEDQASQQDENPKLSKSEIQTIHRLQNDVLKLKVRGVTAIYINKAGTFLESLENGIKEALESSKR